MAATCPLTVKELRHIENSGHYSSTIHSTIGTNNCITIQGALTTFYFSILSLSYKSTYLEFPTPCEAHHVFWINHLSDLVEPLHVPTIDVL